MSVSVESIYSRFLEHPIVATDSRNIPAGSIFFALQGEHFNGNDYVSTALSNGAAFAIVDDPAHQGKEGCIWVKNVLETLQDLARLHRKNLNIPVLAITGTNGKTTTKELINAVLAKKYLTLATEGNLNNHIGVPLTLLKLNHEIEIAVIEMGANHPGEIDFLCRIADPGYGIITNIGKAHLEGFGSFEGVIQTKTELYRYITAKNGVLFANAADPILQGHLSGARTVNYGLGHTTIVSAEMPATPYAQVTVRFPNHEPLSIQSNLYGAYNATNILAAACIGSYFGVSSDNIKSAIEDYIPVNNRSQVVKSGRNTLILDSYNANPSSMLAALTSFAGASFAGKTVILGDMLELGPATDEEHVHILENLAQFGFSNVYLVGPVFTRLNTRRENICFQDSDLARMWFEHHKIEGSTILIKGSRGIRLEKITENL